MSSEDTTVRTFRLRKDWDDVLREEAERQSITVSSLLNQLVRRYAVAQRFFDGTGTMSIDYKIFSPILEMLSEKDLTSFGKSVGGVVVREGLARRGLPVDFESIEFMILEVYDRYSCWFKSNTYQDGLNHVIHLAHPYGEKWSTFVASFMESMLETLLKINIKPEIYETSVIIKIPNKIINL